MERWALCPGGESSPAHGAIRLMVQLSGSGTPGLRSGLCSWWREDFHICIFFFIQMLISDCLELDIVLPSLGTEISAVPLLHSVTLGEVV